MIEKTPYQLAESWVQNHNCKDTIGRYAIKYEEISKNVYKVTCKKCGATTIIENK
jgi:hypothetical protein